MLTVSPKCLRYLCHLHQRHDSFLHPCSSGTTKQYNRKLFRFCPFDQPRQPFTDCPSHAAHQKICRHCPNCNRNPPDRSRSCQNRICQPCLCTKLLQLFLIFRKIQWIPTAQIRIPLLKGMHICRHANPGQRIDPETSSTLWATVPVISYILFIQNFLTGTAFAKHPVWYLRKDFLPVFLSGSLLFPASVFCLCHSRSFEFVSEHLFFLSVSRAFSLNFTAVLLLPSLPVIY